MDDPVVNAFIGRLDQPSDAALGTALGRAKPVWDRLLSDLQSEGVTIRQWKSYSAKTGWSLRTLRGKRTIVWLSPCEGCFQVLFILGDKAVRAARGAGLAAKVLARLDEAPRYPEGTGLRLLVRSARDLPAVRKLTTIKVGARWKVT